MQDEDGNWYVQQKDGSRTLYHNNAAAMGKRRNVEKAKSDARAAAERVDKSIKNSAINYKALGTGPKEIKNWFNKDRADNYVPSEKRTQYVDGLTSRIAADRKAYKQKR